MLAVGAASSLTEARRIIDRSFPVEVFHPAAVDAWDAAYKRFKQFL
jgi:hypothetical protein